MCIMVVVRLDSTVPQGNLRRNNSSRPHQPLSRDVLQQWETTCTLQLVNIRTVWARFVEHDLREWNGDIGVCLYWCGFS